jgi:hypothetical protein
MEDGAVTPLDRYMPDFDVNEIHDVELAATPEVAFRRVLVLPAGSDRIVRFLFRLRGLRRVELPLDRFATEVIGLEPLERTTTRFVACGRVRGVRIGLSFDAVAGTTGGSRLVTETRVADAGLAFRLYWIVVGPFSALIRRRWLRAVERLDRPLQ